MNQLQILDGGAEDHHVWAPGHSLTARMPHQKRPQSQSVEGTSARRGVYIMNGGGAMDSVRGRRQVVSVGEWKTTIHERLQGHLNRVLACPGYC